MLREVTAVEAVNGTKGAQAAAGSRILKVLEVEGILGGLPLGNGEILWCVTEMNTKEEMDQAAAIVRREVKGI